MLDKTYSLYAHAPNLTYVTYSEHWAGKYIWVPTISEILFLSNITR